MPSLFLQHLARRVLVFDGAMGTSIHARTDLRLDRDYLGRENCTEVLVLSRPDVVRQIHDSFLAAGADAVETDTFNANVLTMADQDLSERVYELNKTAAEIARAACRSFHSADKPRFVAGSIGPGTKLVTLGQTRWDAMTASYLEQARGLIDGGVDVLLIETAQDLLQVKCALTACLEALKERNLSPLVGADDAGPGLPLMVQVTMETTGTMLLGSDIAAAACALGAFPLASLGLNCATGPAEMAEHLRFLGRRWPRAVSVQPNAGLPALVNGRAEFPLKPEPFVQALLRYVEESGVSIVGGCCGTTPEHIALLARTVGGRPPGAPAAGKTPARPGCSSLYSVVDYRQDASILNIGERTNASGSRAFKKLLEAEDWDAMVSLAREQTREGSHLIDVNVDYAGRDNPRDMAELVQRFSKNVSCPLMLDSTQPATLEAGLKCAGGKCLINSANLEDGEEKFARLAALARRYGAGLVLGCIDEDPQEAMARTADRKLAIARRLHDLATRVHGLPEEDLFFDPLVLPISTGMDKDRRSALETIEGVRRIAAAFPRCQITCGLSNVSFGLKPAARVVLNSVFLHELVQAGLTSAILHASKILPRTRIPDAQWAAALELIYDKREGPGTAAGDAPADPLQRYIDLFPDQAADAADGAAAAARTLPLEERLQRHIIDGEKQGLVETLEEARAQYPPLAIINDHLLAGMKVVGELFGSGQMQLPFVLQSAEVMKMAVAHLQPYLEKAAAAGKGAIVLATVKGDVHDIGKNLVDIILTNNGYTVYNLGIKQPIAAILECWRQTGADAIGLSGLLVKSVAVMKENLEELNAQGVTVPVLLGGAALSRHYCEGELRATYHGRVYYGRDAFEGLRVMDLLGAGQGQALDQEIEERLAKRAATEAKLATMASTTGPAPGVREVAVAGQPASGRAGVGPAASSAAAPPAGRAALEPIRRDVDIPQPPFLGTRVVTDIAPEDIYPFINRVALFRGQWQFKKGRMDEADYQDQIDEEIEPLFTRLKERCRQEGILRPQVVYGYFPVNSRGDDLVVFDPRDPERELERFTFPRQAGRQGLCISDFFRPEGSGPPDVLGLSCVTVGPEVTQRTRALFETHQYQEYLYLHGLGVESAEALAEYWHKRMRQELGIGNQDSPHIRDLFTQHYRGSRYSFGYPACPDLADQAKLFRLLDPARIGCTLTENWQIDPEQSTSAIIVHHPQARYFAV